MVVKVESSHFPVVLCINAAICYVAHVHMSIIWVLQQITSSVEQIPAHLSLGACLNIWTVAVFY